MSLSHQTVTNDQPNIQPFTSTCDCHSITSTNHCYFVTDIPSSTNCNQVQSHGYQNHHHTMYINIVHQPYTSIINHVHQPVSTMHQSCTNSCTKPCINHAPKLVPNRASTMHQILYQIMHQPHTISLMICLNHPIHHVP
jgi:hypothetical protein